MKSGTPSPFFPNLRRRVKAYEHLDDADSDPEKINASFKQFARINFWLSGVYPTLQKALLRESRRRVGKPIAFLDIGAGSGDIVFRLVTFCREHHIDATFTCLDPDPRAIQILKSRFAKHVKSVRVVPADLVSFLKPPHRRFDFVFMNHVLHHFEDKEIPSLLKTLARRTRRRLWISDIHRTHFSYWGFALFAFFFLRGSFHFHDGLASVRRGFKKRELLSFAAKTGLKNSMKIWAPAPGRMGLVYSKTAPQF